MMALKQWTLCGDNEIRGLLEVQREGLFKNESFLHIKIRFCLPMHKSWTVHGGLYGIIRIRTRGL